MCRVGLEAQDTGFSHREVAGSNPVRGTNLLERVMADLLSGAVRIITSNQIGRVVDVQISENDKLPEYERVVYIVEVIVDEFGQSVKIPLKRSYLERII